MNTPKITIKNIFNHLISVPPHIPQKHHRQFMVFNVASMAGFLAHFAFLLFFVVADVMPLVFFNVGSVLLFAYTFFKNRKEIGLSVLILCYTEVVAHSVATTIYVGIYTGFYYYLFVLLSMGFLTSYKRHALVFMILSMLAAFFSVWYSDQYAPLFAINDAYISFVDYVNLLMSSSIVVAIGYYNGYTATTVEKSLLEANKHLNQQKEEIGIQRDNILISYENNKMLTDIGYKITATLDIELILGTIYEHIEKLMPTDVFGIGLYEHENQQISYQLAIENGKKYKPYSRNMIDKNQFPVWCIENRKEIFINDIEKEYQHYLTENTHQNRELEDGSVAQKARSLIYLPLLAQNKVLGIITVQNYNKNAYSVWHKSMLGTLAVYVASALENAHAYREIDEKKWEIEKHHKNVMDSINVGKRIQNGMLPSLTDIKAVLPESFVLFKPRDVVSGDFYFLHKLDNKIIITVADCTGHGVPGAFMSMIGINFLEDIVKNQKITQPSRILYVLNQKIRQALKQEQHQTREGMDMNLICIDQNKKTVGYSGAMNPLYYIKNKMFKEIKATKNPIGGMQTEAEREYAEHMISFAETPLTLYLCSDGYQDQFGGGHNQKFMVKKLRELLHSISHLPIQEQHQTIDETFEKWKGTGKQIDDVTIVGIRV